jgi:hypothetical protein
VPVFQGMAPPRLLIAADQCFVAGVHVQDFEMETVHFHFFQHFRKLVEGTAAGVHDHGRVPIRCLAAQFRKLRQQYGRQVIHAKIIQVFQRAQDQGLAGTAHAGHNQKTSLSHVVVLPGAPPRELLSPTGRMYPAARFPIQKNKLYAVIIP